MVYIYNSFLIHSSADGHLGCFHVLTIINSAAMNTGVHVSLSDLGEGEGGMFLENNIKTCILSRVKQITSPGWMHETSAWASYTGKTQRNWVEREVGGGIRMGDTCKSMADSCQCMTKTTTIL